LFEFCFCCAVEEVAADLLHILRRPTPFVEDDDEDVAVTNVEGLLLLLLLVDEDGASINVVEQTLVYGLEI